MWKQVFLNAHRRWHGWNRKNPPCERSPCSCWPALPAEYCLRQILSYLFPPSGRHEALHLPWKPPGRWEWYMFCGEALHFQAIKPSGLLGCFFSCCVLMPTSFYTYISIHWNVFVWHSPSHLLALYDILTFSQVCTRYYLQLLSIFLEI